MPFGIPNEADAGFPDQSELDSRDLEIMSTASGGASGSGYGTGPTGVQSGAAVTAQGTPDMTVAVAAGVVRIGGRRVVVATGNVTITAANATNPRFDLITVDTAGTKAAIAGTAAANAVFPAITAGRVVLAAVYVPANDTAINSNQITDKRVLIATPPWEDVTWYGANGNDSADNTTAFADAHATISTVSPGRGGTIYVPVGIYRLAGTILSDPANVAVSAGAAGGPTGTFFYAVSAYNAAGETLATNSSPTSIALTNQIGALTWDAVTNAVGYKVYRGAASGEKFFLAYATTNSYNDTNAATPKGINTPAAPSLAAAGSGSALTNTAYFYVITAYNSAGSGSGETAASATATITPTAGQEVTLTITPPANSGGITGYRVFRGTVSTVDNQWYIGSTTTTTFVDDGKVADHSGRRFTIQPVGLPNRWNETSGSRSRQSGIPMTVNTSRIGFNVTKRGVRILGQSANASSAGGSDGATLAPANNDMKVLQLGDALAIQQHGPSVEHLNVHNTGSFTGVVGVNISGVNNSTLYKTRVFGTDVGFWFGTYPLGGDCAWNDLISCGAFRCTRYGLRAGDSVGINGMGMSFVQSGSEPGPHAAAIGLDQCQHFYMNGLMVDGGMALIGPSWAGGANVNILSFKAENIFTAVDLDSSGLSGQGRGHSIVGGFTTTNKAAPTTGFIVRSVNIVNPRVQSWSILSSLTNGVIDKGTDTLVAAINLATNRGVSRDVIYNVVKLADQSRATTTTTTNDQELLFWMAANTTYRVRGFMLFDTTGAADFKYGFAGPASPTMVRLRRNHQAQGSATITNNAVDTAYPANIPVTGTGTTGGSVEFDGVVTNGATAGYFAFQWAQNTSDAGNTTVLAGSYIDYVTAS